MYQEKIKQLFTSPALGDLWRWSKGSHGALGLLCVVNFLLSGSSLLITLLSRELVDAAVARMPEKLWTAGVAMVAAVLLTRGLSLAERLLTVKTSTQLSRQIRTMLMEKTLNRQYGALKDHHSGELVNRMFSDVSLVSSGILQFVPQCASMLTTLIGAMIILTHMDGNLAVLLLSGGFLGLLGIILCKKPMKCRHQAVQQSQDRFHGLAQEVMENLRLIKASGSEGRMTEKLLHRQEETVQAQLDRGYFSAWMGSGVNIVFQLSWLLCMLWGGTQIYAGKLSFGSLTALLQLVSQVQGPIAGLAGLVSSAYAAVCSGERLREITELPEEAPPDGSLAGFVWDGLTLQNLSFSYGKGRVLEHLDFQLRPGQCVAVTGASGAGKSTLFHLLLGLYPPDSGTLQMQFRDSQGQTQILPVSGSTRFLFAYVPQGNTLFSGTLRENLCLFTDRAGESAIWAALKTACAADFVSQLELGLDTVIGERGLGLSEGQAQRIAIARALLSGAPILLLDESTSALDEHTEAVLLENIAALEGKTCLIVTHRSAALNICQTRLHLT